MSYLLIYNINNFDTHKKGILFICREWTENHKEFETIEEAKEFIDENTMTKISCEKTNNINYPHGEERTSFFNFEPIKLFKIEKEIEIKINYDEWIETKINERKEMNGYSIE